MNQVLGNVNRFMLKHSYVLIISLLLTACQTNRIINWWRTPDGPPPPIELHILGWQESTEGTRRLQQLVNAYASTNPSIKIQIELVSDYEQALRAVLTANGPGGSTPDIVLLDSFTFPNLVVNNSLRALPQTEPASTFAGLIDDFPPALLDAFSVNDILYCLPRDFSTLALVYNKRLFDLAEQPYPSANWTWEELQNASDALANMKYPFYTVYGIVIGNDFSRWLPFLYQNGGRVFAEDHSRMTLDTPEAQDALDFYLDLVLEGSAAPFTEFRSSWGGEAFGQERVGMVIEGNWIQPYLDQEFPDLDYGVVPLPAGPKGRATLAFSSCYAVTQRSEHPVEAFELTDYLTSQEGIWIWAQGRHVMPPRFSLQDEWLAQNSTLEPFLFGVAHAHPWRFPPDFQRVIDAFNSSVNQVFDAEISSEEVLRVVQVIGNDAIEN
ncbi:ABC transporter substrate-binding protein [Chloroflexi bacterium TSY]|nr:ABC transporter substrate-binding protein [Chloroflexi bacterium TSY]